MKDSNMRELLGKMIHADVSLDNALQLQFTYVVAAWFNLT
jgi:hypothetical protein